MSDKNDIRQQLVSYPDPFMRALKHDEYNKGHSDFSVTELIGPPQRSYYSLNFEKVETGYSSFAALMGTAVHTVLEKYVRPELGEMAEERIYMPMFGFNISCKFDYLQGDTLYDYKNTSGSQDQVKPAHYDQVQMNALIARFNGIKVERVGVVYIQRDWSHLQSIVNPNYPKAPFRMFVFDYDEAYAKKQFETRIPEHAAAKQGNPRECTPDEMWEKPTQYAVKKPEAKRAYRVFDDYNEAEEFKDSKKPGEYIIQERKGDRTFCEYFCGFKQHCRQFQKYLAEKEQSDDREP